jgi:hypothetical protein
MALELTRAVQYVIAVALIIGAALFMVAVVLIGTGVFLAAVLFKVLPVRRADGDSTSREGNPPPDLNASHPR